MKASSYCSDPPIVLSGNDTFMSQESMNRKEGSNNSSPNYMKTTASSDAKKEKVLQRPEETRSCVQPEQSLPGSNSRKFKKSIRKLEKSNSVEKSKKQAFISKATTDEASTQLNYSKATSSSDASSHSWPSHDSESSSTSNQVTSTPLSSTRVKFMNKRSSGVLRPTCSSVLKGPENQSGRESQETSITKICKYRYCSVEGHQNVNVPPFNIFLSKRRHALRTQKTMKQERRGDNADRLHTRSNVIQLVKEAFQNIQAGIPGKSSENQCVKAETAYEDHIETIKTEDEAHGEISLMASGGEGMNKRNIRAGPVMQWIISDKLGEMKGPQSAQANNEKRVTYKGRSKVVFVKGPARTIGKTKKQNLRGPRYLPVNPDHERETVNLRHLETQDRKCSNEWMIDCMLQQFVSKLTPHRQRKVDLLVEAFETVKI